jgi:hypothetical protein
MFARILSYHQVNPSYVNFCLCFGLQKNRPRDFRFSSFLAQSFVTNSSKAPEIKSLGRSGLHFQLSYNLRAIECSSNPDTRQKDMAWARRQAAFHHQFDVVYGTSLGLSPAVATPSRNVSNPSCRIGHPTHHPTRAQALRRQLTA